MASVASALAAGDAAPDFELADEEGTLHRLGDYRGRTVVLYFYPKDHTSGCTREACDFRDRYEEYREKGAVVLGVSPDGVESHAKFKVKHGLPFPLLADPGRKACAAYGVWKEKSLYGRTFMGVERSTFVIGPDGRLRLLLRKVKAPDHALELLGRL